MKNIKGKKKWYRRKEVKTWNTNIIQAVHF